MKSSESIFSTVIYLDTNIVLEGLPLAELPWQTIDATGPILILLTPTLLREVDAKKKDGRLGTRAREFNRMVAPLATSGKSLTLQTSPVRVEVALAKCRRIDWDAFDGLDSTQGDDCLIAEALNAADVPRCDRTLVVSHDINPLFTAQRHGLEAFHVQDSWLRPPEPGPQEKEIGKLKQQLADYKKSEPELDVHFEVTPTSIELYRIQALTEQEAAALVRRILEKNPKPVQNRPEWSGMADVFGQYDHTLDDRYKSYASAAVPDFVGDYARHLEMLFNQVPFTISLRNNGKVRADSMRVDVHVVGGYFNPKATFVRPDGPQAPTPKNPLYVKPFFENIPEPYRPAGRHEVEIALTPRQASFSLQCADFRQGQDWSHRGWLILDAHTDEPPRVIVKVTAANLHGTATQTYEIQTTIESRKVSDMVDSQELRVIHPFHILDVLEKAAEKKDFSEIEWAPARKN